MGLLPLHRLQGISVQHIQSELLVYDEQTNRAFCLNAVPAAIWPSLDGTHTVAELAILATCTLGTEVPEEMVQAALDELRRNHLLAPTATSLPAPAASMLDRRTLLGRLGAASALMLPVVTAIAAPRAAQAYGTPGGGACVLGETPIQLASGAFAPIATLAAGQWFRSFDQRTGSFQTNRIVKLHERPCDDIHTLVTASGETLQASGPHLLLTSFTDRYGSPANTLKAGDPLLVLDRKRGRVVETTLLSRHASSVRNTVYHIEAESAYHHYVAAGLISPPICQILREKQQDMMNSTPSQESESDASADSGSL